MKVFVLHYTPLVERKKHIENEMRRENMQFEFILDYDREQLTDADTSRFTDKVSLSEQSLVLKHLHALRKIVDANYEYALVLEDDINLDRGFKEKLEFYQGLLPEDWDMVFIGNGCNLHIPEKDIIPGKFIYKKGHAFPGATRCTDSMLISNKCARAILEYIDSRQPEYKIEYAADWLLNNVLRSLNANVYWTEPTIVTQGSQNGLFETSIQHS